MAEAEIGTPTAASVPVTPDTPGGPLFSSVRIDSLDRDSFGMGRCNMCMPGGKSNGCIANFSAGVGIPSVSLTQK
ncbi:aquaporin NIP5-1-like, partial [Trifolium medium]|nr:aquaporin NIP5-1-like [Trifolium medium]